MKNDRCGFCIRGKVLTQDAIGNWHKHDCSECNGTGIAGDPRWAVLFCIASAIGFALGVWWLFG